LLLKSKINESGLKRVT